MVGQGPPYGLDGGLDRVTLSPIPNPESRIPNPDTARLILISAASVPAAQAVLGFPTAMRPCLPIPRLPASCCRCST